MWNTRLHRSPSSVSLNLSMRKQSLQVHSTSHCLTAGPAQYSTMQIGISVTLMLTNSFLLGLRQQTGQFGLHSGAWNFYAKHQSNTIRRKIKSSLFFDFFWFCELLPLNFLGKGKEEVLLHHLRSCTLRLFYKGPSWQHSPCMAPLLHGVASEQNSTANLAESCQHCISSGLM